MDAEVLASELGDAESVIAGTEPYNRDVILGANSLRVVARTSAFSGGCQLCRALGRREFRTWGSSKPFAV